MNINIYNPYVRAELELYHHGIMGQRWGKRNGPPYPLSAGAHSASEKKAGWRKSLDKSFGSTSTSRSKPPKSSGVKKIKSAIKKKIDSITPEQKAKAKKIAIKALKIAGAVVITAAVAYAGVKLDKDIYGKLSKNYSKAVTDTAYWKHVYESVLDQDKISRGIYNYGIDSGINRGKIPFQQMQLAGLKAGNAKVALDAYKRITRRK